MRICRIIGGVVGVALGLFLLAPVVITAWSALAPGHEERFTSVFVAGRELTGWEMWAFVSLLAVIGIALGAVGTYALRSRKSVA